MGFTAQFEGYVVREWKEYYLSYAWFKRALKRYRRRRQHDPASPSHGLEDPLLDVDSEEDEHMHDMFVDVIHGRSVTPTLSTLPEDAPKFNHELPSALSMIVTRFELEIEAIEKGYHIIFGRLQARFDALLQDPYDTLDAFERAQAKKEFISLYRRCNLFVNFVAINVAAVRRILDKASEHAGETRIKEPLLQYLGRHDFYFSSRLSEFIQHILSTFSAIFDDGKIDASKVYLLSTIGKQHVSSSWRTKFGFKLGSTVLLLLWILVSIFRINAGPSIRSEALEKMKLYMPLYRTFGLLTLFSWFWGTCVYIWTRCRINFVYCFQLDPYTRLTFLQIWDEAANLSIVFMLNLLLFLQVGMSHSIPHPRLYDVFPISLGIFFLLKLTLPVFSHWQARNFLFRSIGRIFSSPLYKVTFIDNLVADVLTSMVKLFLDLELGIEAITYINADQYRSIIVAVISALPFWFRFMQCARMHYDTRQRSPHMWNALKYFCSYSVVIFGAFHPNASHFETHEPKTWYRVAYIVSIVVTTLYVYTWDIVMDWGLAPPGLRPVLLFQHPWRYYAAMVSNLVFRFAWVITLLPSNVNPFYSNTDTMYYRTLFLPAIAAIELYRRCQWSILRVEHEHIRRSMDFQKYAIPIPALLPVNSKPAQGHENQSRRLFIEIASMAVVLLLVGILLAFS